MTISDVIFGKKKKKISDDIFRVKPVEPKPTGLRDVISGAISRAETRPIQPTVAPTMPLQTQTQTTIAPPVTTRDSFRPSRAQGQPATTKPVDTQAIQLREQTQELIKDIENRASQRPLREIDRGGPFGGKIKVARTVDEYKSGQKIFGLPEFVPPRPGDPEYDDYVQSVNLRGGTEQAFGLGFIKPLGSGVGKLLETAIDPEGVSPAFEGIRSLEEQEKIAQAVEPGQFGAGQLTGSLVRSLGAYTGASSIVDKLGLTGAKSLAGKQGVALLVDTIAQAPFEALEFVTNDKDAGEDVKQFVKNRAVDVAFNLVFQGLEEGIKSLKNIYKGGDNETRQLIESQINRLSPQQQLDVLGEEFKTLTKPTRLSAEIFADLPVRQIVEEATPRPVLETVTTRPVAETAVEAAQPQRISDQLFGARTVAEDTGLRPDTLTIPTETPTRVSQFTQTALKSDATGSELKNLIKNNPEVYTPTTNAERIEMAKEIVDSNFDASLNMIKQGDAFSSDIEAAVGLELVERLQKAGRFDDSLDVINSLSKKGTKAGQQIQLFSIWSKQQPEGMVKWANRTLDQAGVKLDPDLAKQIDNDMRFIQSADTDQLKQKLIDGARNRVEGNALARLINDESQQRLKDLNTALVMKSVTDQIPVSLGRKISTFQAISHLLNAKTMLRNIFGNTSFALAEYISKTLGVPFDMLASLKTGKRTTALPKFITPFKEGYKRGKQSLQEILLGVEVADKGKFELFRGETFKAPVLNQAEKALSVGLKTPDEFFKGYQQTNSLYQQVRARIGKDAAKMDLNELIENATAQEIRQAAEEARYATFQDDSLPAQLLTSLKDATNKLGIGKKTRGASGIMTREFGAGDFLVKYTKVPGNLIARSVEYSPAGYVKALIDMSKGKGQRQIANTLGRATTGMGLITIGTWLANKGIIVSEDKNRSLDAKALDRAEGLGNYKVNVSALERLLDGQDTTAKTGDQFQSYNWNQPVGTALAIGTTLNNNMEEGQIQPSNVLARSMEEMLDLPTLSIIQKMFYEGMSDDENKILNVASIPLTEGASGFVPGPVRQLAQFTDPTLRSTKGETPLETAALRLQSSIPGFRQQLEPRISPLGEEMTATTGPFETFISPGIVSEFKPSEITPKLKQIEDLTGEDNIYPSRKAPNTVTLNRETYELTPSEKTEYQRLSGTAYNDMATDLLADFRAASELNENQLAQLVSDLEKIKKISREYAKEEILKQRLGGQ